MQNILKTLGLRGLAPPDLEVALRAAPVFLSQVAGAGLGFLLSVALARLFGSHGIGTYFLALAVTNVAIVLSRAGLDNVVLRRVARHERDGDLAGARGTQRRASQIVALLASGAGLTIVVAAPALARLFGEADLTPMLRIMALAVPTGALLALHAEALRGAGNATRAHLLQVVGPAAVALALLLLWGDRSGVTAMAGIFVVASALMLLLALRAWRARTSRGPLAPPSANALLREGLPLLVVAAMSFVMAWTDTLMLGAWAGTADVGVYGAALRVASLTAFVLLAVNSITARRYAYLHAEGRRGELEDLARRSTGLMVLAAAPIVIALLAVPGLVLGVFGAEFPRGAGALRLLVLGQAVNVLTGSVGYLLMMTGHERLMRDTIVAAGVANVLLNALLVPRYGMTGAAAATAASLAGMNLASMVLVHRHLGIRTLPLLRGLGDQS